MDDGDFLAADFAQDVVLLQDAEDVAPGPVNHQTHREFRQHQRDDEREVVLQHLLRLVRHGRRQAALDDHGDAVQARPRADGKRGGRVEGKQAEEVEQVGRVRRRKVVDPAPERRLAQLDRQQDGFVQREENRDLDQQWPAAAEGVHVFLLVKLENFHLELFTVVGIFGLQLLKLRPDFLHARHGAEGFIGQRENRGTNNHGYAEDAEPHIAGDVHEEMQQVEERLGDEVIYAEVESEVHVLEAVLFVIGVDQGQVLDAGKDIFLVRDGLPRLRCLRIAHNVGLV